MFGFRFGVYALFSALMTYGVIQVRAPLQAAAQGPSALQGSNFCRDRAPLAPHCSTPC